MIELHDIIEFARTNQMFTGLAAAGGLGSVVYWAKAIPAKILNTATWAFSTEIEISNDSEAYQPFLEWMEAHAKAWHTRNFKVSTGRRSSRENIPTSIDDEDDIVPWTIAPGAGSHLIWFNGWPYRASRDINEQPNGMGGQTVREVIRIKTPGFKKRRLIDLVEKIQTTVHHDDWITVSIWQRGYWNRVRSLKPRDPESIVLGNSIKEQLFSDIEWFKEAKSWYSRRGVPWRRSYLFSGHPGTGKSSLAMAVAGRYNMPMYFLNLGSIKSDDALIDACAGIPFPALLLIEDIDTVNVTAARKDDDGDSKAISLGALLNVLDGAIAQEGRIVIMTTNHPDRIDPALMRSGRVDVHFDFENAGVTEINQIYSLFFDRHISLTPGSTLSPAAVQGICLEHANDAKAAAKAIREACLCVS